MEFDFSQDQVYCPQPGESRQADQAWARAAGHQIAAVLTRHGAEYADVELLVPSMRRLRKLVRRQRIRQDEAARRGTTILCDMPWRGCPTHGDFLVRRSRWGRMCCDGPGCSARVRKRMRLEHCDQRAVAVIADEFDQPQYRCAGHMEDEHRLNGIRYRPRRVIEWLTGSTPDRSTPTDGGEDTAE